MSEFQNSPDTVLRYICDGWQAKEHDLLGSSSPYNFKILTYFDEVELCNPIGSNTKLHKLG